MNMHTFLCAKSDVKHTDICTSRLPSVGLAQAHPSVTVDSDLRILDHCFL